jgi:hypothetical protein
MGDTLKNIGKVILFPVYAPYKLIKSATEKGVPEDLKEQLMSDTAQHYMSYGIKPEEAFKLSKEFWEKNKDKLKEAVKTW